MAGSGAGSGARTLAVVGLVLLVPVTILTAIMTLSTDHATRCVMYGEGCSSVSFALIQNLFIASMVVGLVAALWPKTWQRYARTWRGVVAAQWGAQLVMAVAILSYG